MHIIRNGGTAGLSLDPEKVSTGSNSGYQALNLAVLAGAKTVILLGFDGRPAAEGKTHWFGDHPRVEPLTVYPVIRDAFKAAAEAIKAAGVSVLNCSPGSAIETFPRADLAEVLGKIPRKPPLVLVGMHGFGDDLHQRAIVRELMRENEVWLRTPFPQLYWDMPHLHLLRLNSPIAWMAKNEARCAGLFGSAQPPAGTRTMSNGYLSKMPRRGSSVLGIMAEVCGVPVGDFRMPIAPEWAAKADELLARLAPKKPLLIYRPLIAINEANTGMARAKVARNPDLDAYHALIAGIRDRYFVISVADVTTGYERLVGTPIEADAEFHHGELDFETIAALFARAALVYTSPCFATVLAQAAGAPMICVFGGFECKDSFAPGARYSPCCFIEPVKPCACWSHGCTHDKTIDLPAARERIEQFITETECKPC